MSIIEPLFVLFGSEAGAAQYAAKHGLSPMDFVSSENPYVKARVENTSRRIVIVSLPRPFAEVDTLELRELADLATAANQRNGFTRPEVRHVQA